MAAILLIGISVSGQYCRVERVAIFIGLFELVFVLVVLFSHPDPYEITIALTSIQPYG
jgi:Mn2+/Fe2+ NRAMP family transporter